MDFDDFLSFNNINVKYVNLTTTVRGLAYYNGVQYLVLINAKFGCEQQQFTVVHELAHILENHFVCLQEDRAACEKQAHSVVKEMKTKYLYKFI